MTNIRSILDSRTGGFAASLHAQSRSHARYSLLAGSLLISAALVPLNTAHAQTQGQIAPPTRDELLPPERVQPQANPTLTIEGGMERPPCALDRPEYAELKFTLKDAEYIGLEAVPGLSLAKAHADYNGREVPLSVLCDIRAEANSILRTQGYLASVEIPEQSLADGVPDFRVVFGRLTAVRVRGEAGPSEKLVAAYLEKLTRQEVFNTNDAERYLLLTNDLPGVDVRLSLRPAANGGPGELVGEVAVLRQRGMIDANIQNYGSQAVGEFGGLLRAEIYDVTGLGDRTSLSVFSTLDFVEQQTFLLEHDFSVGSEGLRFGTQFVFSQTKPDIGLAGFEIESETILAGIDATYPLKRTRQSSTFAALGFEYVDQDVEVNALPLSKDRVRVLFARLSGSKTDRNSVQRIDGYTPYEPKFRYTYALEARQGVDVFSASPDCRQNPLGCVLNTIAPPSRIEADPTPFVVRYDGSLEYRPNPDFTFFLQTKAQWSDAPLPAFEEFAAGNFSIGRGYDPGAVLGDSGLGLRFELRQGSLAPKDVDSFAVQPYVFTDAAWAWNNDPSRKAGNPDRLWSAGGGVRAAWGSRMQGDLTIAAPITRPDLAPQLGDVRVMFTLSARLYPWSF